MIYELVTPKLEGVMAYEPRNWLILDAHPEFRGHWEVHGLTDDYKYSLADFLGPYRAISPYDLESFRIEANAHGYKLAFFEDPMTIIETYRGLDDPPPFSINSSLPDTINGMLPYQVQGFNFLKGLRGGVARWDTGTGKTVLASGLVKYYEEEYDICFFVVKKNNKVNTVRKLQATVGASAMLINGTAARRQRLYQGLRTALDLGQSRLIVVMNYEQFGDFVEFYRNDNGDLRVKLNEIGEGLFPDRRLLCIWDEMPMKLKTRTTRRYMAICHCLYDTVAPKVSWERKRPSELRQFMLSATPIEKDPEDWFNCVRLLDPEIYGTVSQFYDEYVAAFSYHDPTKPEDWHKFDKMALKAAHIVHQVDKTDPDIAAVFPKVVSESLYIDWNDEALKLYKQLEKLAKDAANGGERMHVLSLINLFQMICDAPEMLLDSAARREVYESALEGWESVDGDWATKPQPDGSDAALEFLRGLEGKVTNKNHAKLDALHEILTFVHPDDKVVIFSKWNASIMPILEANLQEWGIQYVRYHGTETQKQIAQDAFQENPEVRVFLSSDAGSDSIDLDAGSVVVHYDLPWNWTTYIQRQNRVHRATSKTEVVRFYTLLMADSIEDRILDVILRKQGYHDSLFKPIAGISSSARISRDDLLYILTG